MMQVLRRLTQSCWAATGREVFRRDGLDAGSVLWLQLRGLKKKIRRKKGPVESLSSTPNSIAALMSDRRIPQEMDLREVWDRAPGGRMKRLRERLGGVDSTTRFDPAETEKYENEEPSNQLMLATMSSQLSDNDVQRYYKLEKGLIQEAFREFYKTGGSGSPVEIPQKGCNTLYNEVQLTGSAWLLHRTCMQELRDLLSESEPAKIWLEGRSGSGKSMALISAVEWARQNNWLVLYLPSASALLSDSFFVQRSNTDAYDTIVAAKDILRSVYMVYGGESSALSSLSRTQTDDRDSDLGQTLDDLCRIGLSTGDPAVACNAALQLLHEFLFGDHGVEKLVAVDDYNALYWKTRYFHWKSELHKVMIPAERVTLANAFRIFERSEALQSHVLVAPTRSSGVSSSLWIPKEEPVTSLTIPPFTQDEMHCALYYYWKQDLIQPVDVHALKRLHFITAGNMHELKGLMAVL